MTSVNLVANTDLKNAEEFRQLVVKQKDGVVVRLGEIADVVLGAEDYESNVQFNGQGATFMGIWVLPTANSLDVIKRVRAEIPEIQSQLPAGMKVGIPYDATEYIQDAINEVLSTLSETLVIVIIVIFLFLGSFRAVLIPIVAIPISLVGAVFLMLVAGFTINLLTLLAIVLSVGLVVDDAIVMVENVERHLALGEKPFEAAIKAARELVGPIIAMTITLAAVYAPIGIQGGLTGALFREFAFTLAGAVVISGIVALTLSPMMGSKFLRSGDTEKGFAGWINRRFEKVRATLRRAAHGQPQLPSGRPDPLGDRRAPHRSRSTCSRPKELAPTEDQSVVFGVIQAAPNATLDQTNLFTEQVYDVYNTFPENEGGLPDHLAQRRLRGHGHEALERAKEEHVAAAGRGLDGPLEDSRHPRHLARAAGPARRRQLPGRLRHRLHGRARAADRVRQPARRQGVRRAASSCSPTRTSSSTSRRPRSSSTATSSRSQGVDLGRPAATSRRCSAATT